MDEKYDFKKIEIKWQKAWNQNPNSSAKDFDSRPKHYQLVEFPYPSGAGLHVGHCMGYTASDAYCRMKRMQGENVLFPIGWDAFGLPTENYAIKTGIKPAEATKQNIETFKKQMKRMAYSFDFEREIDTTDPDYYRWTQWIFLQFYKHGIDANGKLIEIADDDMNTPRLAYQAEMAINWCPSCKIGLANEEVIGGKCERCNSIVTKKTQKQWMLRITAYADRLIKDLDTVNYLEKIKTQQVNWIGRSTGSNIKFEIRISKSETNSKSKTLNPNQYIEVFTTRADTLFGCTYLVLSPEHKEIRNLKSEIKNYKEIEDYIENAKKKSDMERTELAKDKTGVKLEGVRAINPINDTEVEIWVADYVLAGYGTGAVMAVPAHDERDWQFAKKFNIPIIEVIQNSNLKNHNDNSKLKNNSAYTDYGTLVNSGSFNGLNSEEAKEKITAKLKIDGNGDFSVNYKLRDWVFSRQHYWGEPIPIIYCRKCWEKSKIKNPMPTGRQEKSQLMNNVSIINDQEHLMVPVPEEELPVILPDVENYQPTNTGQSPLANINKWVKVKCPKCGEEAKRETDTMPNWAGSSWYFLAYALKNTSNKLPVTGNRKNIFVEGKKALEYWMPVDLYNGGMEHTTLHLLYSRFWHKFLYDLGLVPESEPYQKRIAHGIILGADGRKMSKSFGNVVNPDEIVDKFGADTLRAYIMFIGPYDTESAWNMAGVQGIYRFINKLWENYKKSKNTATSEIINSEIHKLIKEVESDIDNFSLNTYIAKLMTFNNILTKEREISVEVLKTFTQLLSLVMPHLACELWELLGEKESIFQSVWPKFDQSKIKIDRINIPIQVAGKLRDLLSVEPGKSKDDLEKLALKSEKVQSFIKDKPIKKIIVVPDKIISIVL